MGRPTKYNETLAFEICERIGGGDLLKTICAEKGMPSKSTVLKWVLDEDKKLFADLYARAREFQAHALFEECLEIADDASEDHVTKTDRKGNEYEAIDHENIQRSRLRVDTRKWMCAKLNHRKYGDRVSNQLEDNKGGPLVLIDGGKDPYSPQDNAE